MLYLKTMLIVKYEHKKTIFKLPISLFSFFIKISDEIPASQKKTCPYEVCQPPPPNYSDPPVY